MLSNIRFIPFETQIPLSDKLDFSNSQLETPIFIIWKVKTLNKMDHIVGVGIKTCVRKLCPSSVYFPSEVTFACGKV